MSLQSHLRREKCHYSHLRRDSVITKSLKEGKVSLQSHLRRDSVITKSLREGQCHYKVT